VTAAATTITWQWFWVLVGTAHR